MTLAPLQYLGEGQFQAPKNHARRLDKELVIGEQLNWEQVHERSSASHKHYFALINEAWQNLPETLVPEFPNAEKLRKWALIKAGYCSEQKLICRENKEAVKASAIMSAMDAFAICNVEDSMVTVWRASSQSVRAMGTRQFQESKDKVLSIISQLIGSDITEKTETAA